MELNLPISFDINNISGGVGELVLQAGPVAKVVLIILLLFSVVCWALIADKYWQFRRAHNESMKFLKVFRDARRISTIHSGSKKFKDSPFARLFQAGYQELIAIYKLNPNPETLDFIYEGTEEGISSETMDNVTRVLRRATSAEISRFEKNLIFLATTASTSPFIGLFGTVWGIMNAFRHIGTQGSASLAVVAPGISEALVSTAAGLAAAIPAVIAYNYFVNRVRFWAAEMDNFSSDFISLIQRGFSKSSRQE